MAATEPHVWTLAELDLDRATMLELLRLHQDDVLLLAILTRAGEWLNELERRLRADVARRAVQE